MSQPDPRPLKLVAVYGSPRRAGNTARLLERVVAGAREAGAAVEEIFLGDLKLSPCLEDGGCRDSGRCVLQDDFPRLFDLLAECDGILLASPIFFGSVSAQAKILIDRCQCFWAGKYLLGRTGGKPPGRQKRPGLFVAAAARRPHPDLFEGAVRTVRYFFDALDVVLCQALLYAGLEEADDVLGHEDYLQESCAAGRRMVTELGADLPG